MNEQEIECTSVLWADDVPVVASVKHGQRCKGCGSPVETLVCAYCGRRFRIRDD